MLRGERVGTIFHKDAHLWTSIKEVSAHEMAVSARDSSRRLQVSEITYIKCEQVHFHEFLYVAIYPILISFWLLPRKSTQFGSLVLLHNWCFWFQLLNSEERSKILLAIADALEKNEDKIRMENGADVADAEEIGYEKPLISRLTLRPEKVRNLILK